MKKVIPILFTILIISGLTAQNENNQNALNGVLTPIQQAVGMNNTNTAEKAKATSSEQRATSTYTKTEDYIDETYEEETYADETYEDEFFDDEVAGIKLKVDEVINPRSNVKYNPYVVDMCHAFTQSEINRMTSILEDIEVRTTCQVIVVAVPGIEGDDEDSFAHALFNKWGIGFKGKDNGLLLLYVKDIRAIRFETGYGLEGLLPDAYLSKVMHDVMFPLLKEGRIGDGVINGLAEVAAKLTTEEAIAEMMTTHQSDTHTVVSGICYWLMISVIVTLLFAFSIYKNTTKDKKGEKKNDKTGENGKDKGTEAIVAANTGIIPNKEKKETEESVKVDYYLEKQMHTYKLIWILFPTILLLRMYLKRLRKELRLTAQVCPQCGGKMHLLQPELARQYYTKADETENRLHSVDNNYWECDTCKHRKKISYPKVGGKYTQCPQCGAYASSIISSSILTLATTTRTGTKKLVHRCECCNHEYTTTQILPKISSGGSGTGGGSSFGGGGSSFGGGSSGGGGVSGRF